LIRHVPAPAEQEHLPLGLQAGEHAAAATPLCLRESDPVHAKGLQGIDQARVGSPQVHAQALGQGQVMGVVGGRQVVALLLHHLNGVYGADFLTYCAAGAMGLRE
jgi:hypothetical protein